MKNLEVPASNFGIVEDEIVKNLEKLNLDNRQKAEILYVMAGLKPAAWVKFDVRVNKDNEDTVYYKEDDIKAYYDFLNGLSLPHKIIPRRVETEKVLIGDVEKEIKRDLVETMVARTSLDLDSLAKAVDSKDHKAIGLALGYPTTAVDAFVGSIKRIDLQSVPKEVLVSDAFIFSHTLTYSNDNWEKEIEDGLKNAEFLKKASPSTYEKIKERAMILYQSMGVLDDEIGGRVAAGS